MRATGSRAPRGRSAVFTEREATWAVRCFPFVSVCIFCAADRRFSLVCVITFLAPLRCRRVLGLAIIPAQFPHRFEQCAVADLGLVGARPSGLFDQIGLRRRKYLYLPMKRRKGGAARLPEYAPPAAIRVADFCFCLYRSISTPNSPCLWWYR